MNLVFNDVELSHLGGGVCLFKNAISADWDNIYHSSVELIDSEHSAMYQKGFHPYTGKELYLNKSGYLFDAEAINSMPRRGSSIHQNSSPKVKEFLNFFEYSKDQCLLKYFEKFPLAYNCVWWKVKGHFVSYGPEVYLGPHSDISAEYVYGKHQTKQELALRNVITSIVYVNSNNTMESNFGFNGGQHLFNYLGIEYAPNAGDILMFPSNFMAAHEVKMVTEGRRISYLGWYCQGTPNPAVGEDVCDPMKNPELASISTNVYLPSLRNDYREFLLSKGYETTSEHFRITELVGE